MQLYPIVTMRIDSCKKCGGEMKIQIHCSTCNKPIKFSCNRCHTDTEEQFHLQCTLIDMDLKLLEARVA